MDNLKKDIQAKVRNYERQSREASPELIPLDEFIDIICYYLTSEQYDNALSCVETAKQYYPYSDSIFIYEAEAHSERSDYDKALSAIEKAYSLSPGEQHLLIRRLIILYKSDQQEAYQSAKDIIHGKEYDCSVKLQAIKILDLLDNKESLNCILTLLKENIDNRSILEQLLDMLGEKEKFTTFCIIFLEGCAEDLAENANLWYALGSIYFLACNYEKAAQAFEYASILNEEDNHTQLFLAKSLKELGQLVDAEKKIKRLLEKNTTLLQEAYIELAMVYSKKGDNTEAIRILKRAKNMDDEEQDNFELFYAFAYVLNELGNYTLAWDYIYKCTDADCKIKKVYWVLSAVITANVGLEDRALSVFEKTASLYPECIDVWIEWSHLLYKQDKTEEALKIIKEGINHSPDSASLYYRATAYCLALGVEKETISFLQCALALNEDKSYELYDFFPYESTKNRVKKIISYVKKF